jgi:uncharacterized membrane protein YphA (DoxX/SURF4 family)
MQRLTPAQRRAIAAAPVLIKALAAEPALALEKWILDSSPYPLRFDLFFQPLPLVLTALVLIVTAAAGWLWRVRGRGFVPGPELLGATPERRSALYSLVPLMLGIHAAVPLLVMGVQGRLFSPNNVLPPVWANFLGLAETGIGLALFYGVATRIAAVLLAGLWLLGCVLVGPQGMLDNSLFLGFAAFFYLAGRGPIAVDRLALPRLEPSPRLIAQAMTALRIGLGASLVVVAFTEKLANLPLGLEFLKHYPLNFTVGLGIPLPDDVFVICAGAVELLVGLWILFGIFTREIVLIAWLPINLTLTIFNWTELVGHLPIYGIMAVLLLWAPGRENLALWVNGLRGGPLAASGLVEAVKEPQ